MKRSVASPGGARTGRLDRAGKKTAAAIHQEVAREVNQLLGRVFAQRHKTDGPIWRRWRWPCARHAPGRRRGPERIAAISRPRRRAAASCLVPAAIRPTTGNCAPNPCSPSWARWRCRVPTSCARAVTPASFPPMSNWTSRTQSSLPECAACRRWWARRRPSITGANR